MSTSARALSWLKASGWICERREHWVGYAGVRRDAWGIGDIEAYKRNGKVYRHALIQVTSPDNASARRRKIMASDHRRDLSHLYEIVVIAMPPKGEPKAKRWNEEEGAWEAWTP